MAAGAGSSAAQDPPAPIVVEPLTPRNVVTDKVKVKYTVKLAGSRTQVINSGDPSRIVVAKITVTVLFATFHDVPEIGPLTITEGVEAPKNCVTGASRPPDRWLPSPF